MFVGIDWGRNAHTIALLKDNGEIMKIFKIRNDYAGYIDLLKHPSNRLTRRVSS
ncbi:unnamed protein product, partial [marine sediment metagenome]